MIAASLVTNLFIIALPSPDTPPILLSIWIWPSMKCRAPDSAIASPSAQGDADLLEPDARLVGEVDGGGGLVVLRTPEAWSRPGSRP